MADLIGAEVSIPGHVWNEPEDIPSAGKVLRLLAPTKTFPAGRLEIQIGRQKFLWDVNGFDHDWVTEMPPPPRNLTPSRQRASRSTTPRRAALKPSAVAPEEEVYSTRARSRSRSGRLTGRATSRATATSSSPAPALTSGTATNLDEQDTAGGSNGWGAVTSPPRARRTTPLRLRSAVTPERKQSTTSQPAAAAGISTAVGADSNRQDITAFGSGGESQTQPKLPEPSQQLQPPPSPGREVRAEVHDGNGKGHEKEDEPSPMERKQTLINAALLVGASLPAIAAALYLKYGCSKAQWLHPLTPPSKVTDILDVNAWCALGYQQPILAVNVLFFVWVDVFFWLLSLVQKSTWLIDPYWTIIPPLIGLFYYSHPTAVYDPVRSAVSLVLLFTWSARLTHSYFRREGWQLGAREDWRFTDMQKQIGKHWWWVSFFAAYISQHAMLVGITLPFAAIHSSTAPWHPIRDTLCTLGAITGITLAFVSDNQLRRFMGANESRRAAGLQPKLLLETGIFKYSRHPNYFGEQLWWWSVAGFAARLGAGWMASGTLFNSLCLAAVTVMVEKRMMRRPERVAAFKEYQATTSVWLPLPKFKSATKTD